MRKPERYAHSWRKASPTFVNYSRMFRHVLKGGKEMIWMSERDNWNTST